MMVGSALRTIIFVDATVVLKVGVWGYMFRTVFNTCLFGAVVCEGGSR